MKRIVCLLSILSLTGPGLASAAGEPEPPKLLGRTTVEQLREQPFAEWFETGYAGYTPHAGVLDALRRAAPADLRVTVFYGTWCGDSRREVPEWLKLFDALGLSLDRVELIGVDRAGGALKRSPGGEERGLEIYRVPTAIVRRGGTEIARVVEFPVLSIERDLLAILEGKPYEPNYAAYPVIRRWLREGLLADPNVSPWGLAGEVRHVVSGEGELGAAARVLQERGDTAEAVKLFQVNCAIHRDSAACHERLAGALLDAGDGERARKAAERALRLNEDPAKVETLVELIERSRGGDS